jgi:hypothetical protein
VKGRTVGGKGKNHGVSLDLKLQKTTPESDNQAKNSLIWQGPVLKKAEAHPFLGLVLVLQAEAIAQNSPPRGFEVFN